MINPRVIWAGQKFHVGLEADLARAVPRSNGSRGGHPPFDHVFMFKVLILQAGSPEKGFSEAFMIRMLFSCLVDADFVETERFYAENRSAERGGRPSSGGRNRPTVRSSGEAHRAW
jgi:hypothetical protein